MTIYSGMSSPPISPSWFESIRKWSTDSICVPALFFKVISSIINILFSSQNYLETKLQPVTGRRCGHGDYKTHQPIDSDTPPIPPDRKQSWKNKAMLLEHRINLSTEHDVYVSSVVPWLPTGPDRSPSLCFSAPWTPEILTDGVKYGCCSIKGLKRWNPD